MPQMMLGNPVVCVMSHSVTNIGGALTAVEEDDAPLTPLNEVSPKKLDMSGDKACDEDGESLKVGYILVSTTRYCISSDVRTAGVLCLLDPFVC